MKGKYNSKTYTMELDGLTWKFKHFFYHGSRTGYSQELQDFANDSDTKWDKSGVLITTEKLWNALKNNEKNIIAPKVAIMFWDTNDNYEVPQWVQSWAMVGMKPVIKQISDTEIIWLAEKDMYHYLVLAEDVPDEPEPPVAITGDYEIIIPEIRIVVRKIRTIPKG